MSPSWIAAPDLLEFRFGYDLENTDNAGRHQQLFRDSSFWTSGTPVNDGFMLRITLEPTAVVPLPASALMGLGLLGLLGAARLLRRRRT